MFDAAGINSKNPDAVSELQNWLKTKLNIDSTLKSGLSMNEYYTMKDGVKRMLTQEYVEDMARAYRAQHPNG